MNKIQTQFESSYLCKSANLVKMNGKYVNPTVQKMWLGWNACANQPVDLIDKDSLTGIVDAQITDYCFGLKSPSLTAPG